MEKGIAEFARLAQEEHTNILRDATGRLISPLVRKTPKKTGVTQASWNIGLNAPAPLLIGDPPPATAKATVDELKAVVNKAEIGDWMEIANANEPVAYILEVGGSGQAPNGWFRLTARRWRTFVKGAARAATNRIRKKLVID